MGVAFTKRSGNVLHQRNAARKSDLGLTFAHSLIGKTRPGFRFGVARVLKDFRDRLGGR